jgi:transcriptional regulator with XRE-family HTH domain
MTYSVKTVHAVKAAPKTLGNTLGRLAVSLDFSVLRLAKATGASRQTVYNWMMGGEVLNPYQPRVERLIEILRAAKDAETAWVQVCKEHNLQA